MAVDSGNTPARVVRIHHEVAIDAPPAQVFDALTRSAGEWFWRGEGNMQPKVVMEPRLGGRFYRPTAGGQQDEGDLYATVTEWAPPRRLRLHGTIGGELAMISVIAVTLEQDGTGTLLKLSHRLAGEVPQADLESYDEGWADELASLKRFAETGKGRGA